MGILIGLEETIRCIAAVDLVGPSGEKLCLAYKTTARIVGGGICLTDDGYVLAVVSAEGQRPSVYFNISEDDISGYQAEGLMPSQLPAYSIPFSDYLLGYSLWIMLAIAIFWGIYSTRHMKRKRRATDDLSEVPSTEPE